MDRIFQLIVGGVKPEEKSEFSCMCEPCEEFPYTMAIFAIGIGASIGFLMVRIIYYSWEYYVT